MALFVLGFVLLFAQFWFLNFLPKKLRKRPVKPFQNIYIFLIKIIDIVVFFSIMRTNFICCGATIESKTKKINFKQQKNKEKK